MSEVGQKILRKQRRRNARQAILKGFATGLVISFAAYGVGCCIGTLIVHAEESVTVPKKIQMYAESIGRAYSICPELLEAIAFRESSFDEDAKNGECIGLMQVSEKWHEDRMEYLNVSDLTDGYSNILVAADYLNELFEEYEDAGMVLMVYNGDSDAYAYAKGEAELSDYADDILTLSAELERLHGK